MTRQGVKDLLRFVDVSNVPSSKERPSAFLFDDIRELPFPTAILFPKAFPSDFSVIATAKPREGSRGFLTTVASSSGETQIAIEVRNTPTFRYAELGGKPTSRSPRFSVDLADGKWHQFSYRVQGSEVTFYMDCAFEMTEVIQRSKMPYIDNSGILTIGPNFQGELEQLFFSDDPNDAALQCPNNVQSIEEDTKILDEVTTFANDILPLMPETEPRPRFATSTIPAVTVRKMVPEVPKPVVLWTPWSPCSVSCGDGQRTRVSYCSGNEITADDCSRTEIAACSMAACPGACTRSCKNGGVCTSGNTCRCPYGYAGSSCEKVLCRVPCENGGSCVAPGRCRCPRGYVGPRCDKAVDTTKKTRRYVTKVVKMAATVSDQGRVPVARDSRGNPAKMIFPNNTQETDIKRMRLTVVFVLNGGNPELVLKVFVGSKVVRTAGNAAHPGNVFVETVSMAATVNTDDVERTNVRPSRTDEAIRGNSRLSLKSSVARSDWTRALKKGPSTR
ncbi:COL5A1 [Branchiostoma lanceolatum]|uniref:COL5A1 protein n=1 Tax=Branchiostoma lanceolatum TaxID=7740 RepID=A0A8K0E9B3_BRALA|nr:COL5A1 [Branchiostoma lanceolatum]